MESSASGSSKRARVPGNGTQIPSCLVDGCTADLGKCRDYHRRHKVCELHSKTPKVTIHGREQRFCQQCSRFHSLEEFDEGKRSCRKRLDGHNRRRRKPQPDSLSFNSGRFLSNPQGTKFIPFGSPELFSTSAAPPAWSGIVKAKTDEMLHNNHLQLDFTNGNLFRGSSSHDDKEGTQFPFLEGAATSALPRASSVCQPQLTANSSLGNCGSSSQKVFSNRLNRVVHSSRALSLLSSPQPQTRGVGLNHRAQTDSKLIPPAQSLITSLNYSRLGMVVQPSNASLHDPDTFEIVPARDESSTSGTHQSLSFSWE